MLREIKIPVLGMVEVREASLGERANEVQCQRRPFVRTDGIVPAFGDLNRFSFWTRFTIIFGLGWIAIMTATLVTRPESMDVLRKFYRDVRPIGFWGPVKAELPAEERLSINARAERNRRVLLGCVLLFFDCAGYVLSHGRAFSGGGSVRHIVAGDRVMFARALVRPSRATGVNQWQPEN